MTRVTLLRMLLFPLAMGLALPIVTRTSEEQNQVISQLSRRSFDNIPSAAASLEPEYHAVQRRNPYPGSSTGKYGESHQSQDPQKPPQPARSYTSSSQSSDYPESLSDSDDPEKKLVTKKKKLLTKRPKVPYRPLAKSPPQNAGQSTQRLDGPETPNKKILNLDHGINPGRVSIANVRVEGEGGKKERWLGFKMKYYGRTTPKEEFMAVSDSSAKNLYSRFLAPFYTWIPKAKRYAGEVKMWRNGNQVLDDQVFTEVEPMNDGDTIVFTVGI